MSAPADVSRSVRPLAALRRIQGEVPLAQLLSLAAVFAYGAATLDGFFSQRAVYSMLVLAAFLGIAAAGQTLVVLIGGIDLSIAGWIVAGATLCVELTGTRGWSFATALALILAIAIVAGGVTGYISHRFDVHPLIVTLATGGIITGATLAWTKGFVTGSPPTWLQRLTSPAGTTFGFGFPPLIVLWAALALVIGLVLRRTVLGRRIYATGANPRAAELALVRTRRVWVGVFAASAVLATVTGVLLAGFAGAGDSSIGNPYLFQSLTAVVVGGTAFGALGDYWRTVVGALVIIVLSTVLTGHGYSSAQQQVFFGVLIFVFAALYGREARLSDRV